MKNFFSKLLKFLKLNREDPVDKAISVIEQHGMKAHFYFPESSHLAEHELALALTVLGENGFIITNSNGDIVGKVCTHGLSSEEKAAIRRSTLKLIDNQNNAV
jgi:hypothetical protein